MKYADTIYAPTDHLAADIYRIEKSNFYIIRFFEVADNGKKYLGKKVRATLNERGLKSLKDEIRENLFQEVFQNYKNKENRIKMDFEHKLPSPENSSHRREETQV